MTASRILGYLSLLVLLASLRLAGAQDGLMEIDNSTVKYYTVSGSYIASGNGPASAIFSDNVSTTLSLPVSSRWLPAWEGLATTYTVRSTNVVSTTISFTPWPQYDLYINGICRCSITLTDYQGANSTQTDNITVFMVPKWRGPSAYAVTTVKPAPLGSSGSIQYENPFNDGSTDAQVINGPRLDFNLGLAKNGVTLPPLSVALLPRTGDSLPAFPDMPEVSAVQQSDGIVWIEAPQVTAIFSLQNCQGYGTGANEQWGGNGNYTISFATPGNEANPFVTYTFTFSSLSWEEVNGSATVTKSMPGVSRTYETTAYSTTYSFVSYEFTAWSFDDWHDSGQPVQRHVAMTLGSDNGGFTHGNYGNYAILTVTDGTGATATSTRIDYKTYFESTIGDGSSGVLWWVPIKETEGYLGSGSYPTQYYTNSFIYSWQVGETSPAGSAAISAMDASNLPASTCKSWLNNVPFGTDVFDVFHEQTDLAISQNGGTLTNYGYQNDWDGLPMLLTSSATTVGSTLLEQTNSNYQFGDSITANGQPLLIKTTSAYADANNSLVTVAKTYRTDAPDISLSDLPYSVQKPDGTQMDYAYEHGTYDAGSQTFTVTGDDTSPDLRMTTLNGLVSGGTTVTALGSVQIDPIGLVANRSTETVDIYQNGFLVRRESWVCTSGASFEQLGWDNFTYSPDGRLISHASSNGTSTTAIWDGDRKTSETDETGLTTTYVYDSMSRVTSVTRQAVGSLPALCTQYTYDADSRVLSTTVGGQLTTTNAYDTGGRLIRQVSAAGVVTQYTYANGGQTVTETLAPGTADETSKTTAYYADGRVQSITGAAVVNEYHTYDFDANGRPRETVNYDIPSGGRSKVIIRDLLGRVLETDLPGFGNESSQANGNAVLLVSYSKYNSLGQLYDTYMVRSGPDGSEQPISAHQLTQYDAFGEVSASGLDLDGDGTLSATGPDRFVASTNTFTKDSSGIWWNVTTTQSYTDAQGDSNQAQIKTQVSGFSGGLVSKKISYDFYGNATTETVYVYPNYGQTVDTITLPDGSDSAKISEGGFLIAEQEVDANGTPIHIVWPTYDTQGRQIASTDSRTGTSRTAYYPNSDLVHTVTDATGAVVATNAYDNAGRINSVTDANGHTIITSYNPRSQVTQQSGTGTYPVQYDYDSYAQKVALRTYRNGLNGTADQTNFAYDVNTGWLMGKTDATGQQVTFNYVYDFADGYKQTTRTWSRGVTTTTNLSLSTGDLVSVSYSDGTPSVSYTYTRDGHASTVTDATGTRDLAYNKDQLASEALDPAWFNGLIITHNYEAATTATTVAGRYAGFSLGYATNGGADLDKEMAVAYTYDNASRLSTLTANYKAQGPRPALSVPFAYHYLNQSSLWDRVDQNIFAQVRQFEPARDVLTGLSATWNGIALADYHYVTNAAGQCEAMTQDGTAFVDYGDSTGFAYGYDTYGQLATATGFMGSDAIQQLPGRDLSYNYDTAGNRTTVGVDSESVAYTDDSGNPGGNALNQVRNRGTLKTRFSGTADPNATVTANGVTASRQGRYWDAIAFGNSAQNTQVNVSAILGGQSQSASLWALQRPAQETLNYDADGNLLADSAWTYTWDAENRLVHMATNGYAFGVPNTPETIDFTYDYLDRRVRKVVTLNGNVVSDHKYIYQGWLLLAEFSSSALQPFSLSRSYTWGLDQSGSLDGGGGVGGLVLETAHTPTALTAYDVAHDGDDNVTALVNTASGVFGAVYEYDPFGQLLRSEGGEAANNPFQFSTKYRDHETGLIYYGYRYYDPSLARFINRDPKEEAGGLNLYGFVTNDPLWHWDYLGMSNLGEENTPTPPPGRFDTSLEAGRQTCGNDTRKPPDGFPLEMPESLSIAGNLKRNHLQVDLDKGTSVSSNDTPNGQETDSYASASGTTGQGGDNSVNPHAAALVSAPDSNDPTNNGQPINTGTGAPNKTGWKGVQYAGGTTTLPTYTVDGGKGGIPVVVNAWDDPVYHGGEYVIGLGRDEYGSMTNPDGTPIKLATFSVSAPRSSNNTPVTARGPGVDEFVSSSGTAAGVFGISLDMMRSVGHFGRGMGKVLETGSRRLGVFGLLASGYNISTGNAGWRDYTDFGAGVATLTVEGAAAPWVAAAAGAFTLWELGTDLITPERPH